MEWKMWRIHRMWNKQSMQPERNPCHNRALQQGPRARPSSKARSGGANKMLCLCDAFVRSYLGGVRVGDERCTRASECRAVENALPLCGNPRETLRGFVKVHVHLVFEGTACGQRDVSTTSSHPTCPLRHPLNDCVVIVKGQQMSGQQMGWLWTVGANIWNVQCRWLLLGWSWCLGATLRWDSRPGHVGRPPLLDSRIWKNPYEIHQV